MSKVLFSSISKKFIMALAGLFLITFLPVHLIINLMLLRSDPEPFTKAAHFMATFPVVKIFEVILFAAIVIHISWGIFLQIKNWLARPVGYVGGNKAETSFFSRYMIWTGSTVFIFLILHFFNFYFVKIGLVKGNPEDFYNMAHSLFAIPAYSYIYLACFAILGFHLNHAFSSAFQTLGLNHRIWTPVVKVVAFIYSIVIPVGFACVPVILWISR
jgi:succinate dehydrogenase / fumarate reductase cytochrome b subunit